MKITLCIEKNTQINKQKFRGNAQKYKSVRNGNLCKTTEAKIYPGLSTAKHQRLERVRGSSSRSSSSSSRTRTRRAKAHSSSTFGSEALLLCSRTCFSFLIFLKDFALTVIAGLLLGWAHCYYCLWTARKRRAQNQKEKFFLHPQTNYTQSYK